MLNAEKFKEEIKRCDHHFAIANGHIVSCTGIPCKSCKFYGGFCRDAMVEWLLSEYEPHKIEPEVYDLKVDDEIEVSSTGAGWRRRYFKCIKDGVVIAWSNGRTSFSASSDDDVTEWEYARIPREE